jgi:FSR family fosmidomycin resistance protein-like MFS transporter
MTSNVETLQPAASTEDKFQTEQIMTIVGGHFVHDTYSAFAAPLLPLLIQKLSLSLTVAGSLWIFFSLPALLNPFIGYVADRVSMRYLVILAPAVTATVMSSLGLAPNIVVLAILLFVAGISIAAFHAPAPAMIGRLAGTQLGKGMSFFMAGGELGRTVGPILAVWAVSVFTLEGMYRIMVVGWATSLILYWRLHNISARTGNRQSLRAFLPAARRVFVPLLGIVVPRQFILTALTVYLPTYMSLQGASLWVAGASLSILELAGVAGALTGGIISDRLGRKVVLILASVSSSALMILFLGADGWLLVPILLALGFTALSTGPVMLALVQEYLPENRATANGLYVFLAFFSRSLAAFVLGIMGDKIGLQSTYLWATIISLLVIPAVFLLPKTDEPTGISTP